MSEPEPYNLHKYSYVHIDLCYGRLAVCGEGKVRDLFDGYRDNMRMDEDVGNAAEELARALYQATGEYPVIHLSNE